MRGKLPQFVILPEQVGITPADAGKTSLHVYAHGFYWDHPRGCGENRGSERIMHWATGSPPRMRGKHLGHDCNQAEGGITPADAGKTLRIVLSRRSLQDHPRGCGENRLLKGLFFRLTGSPPRMRGKRLFREPFKAEAGITPADAGKTLWHFQQHL